MFVTDCDYCGDVSLCFNDNAGGCCCTLCGDAETGDINPNEDDGQPTMYDEYQDLYGGDYWDHDQFDEMF